MFVLSPVQKNIGTIDNHVEDYQRMIENLQVCLNGETSKFLQFYLIVGHSKNTEVCRIVTLQGEVSQLKKELADKEHQLSVKPTEKAADNELSWLNVLSQETGENVQERINLQKALFELEETNKRNRMELQHLDGAIARPQVGNLTDQFFENSLSNRLQQLFPTSIVTTDL